MIITQMHSLSYQIFYIPANFVLRARRGVPRARGALPMSEVCMARRFSCTRGATRHPPLAEGTARRLCCARDARFPPLVVCWWRPEEYPSRTRCLRCRILTSPRYDAWQCQKLPNSRLWRFVSTGGGGGGLLDLWNGSNEWIVVNA